LALGWGLLAASARGDGDPASDVLVSQSLFLPQDAAASVREQAQLARVLAAARSSGYPLRVALIATRTDLGSVTALWRQPESYARFLGQELALVYRGALIVVMPNGYGTYRLPHSVSSVLPHLDTPGRDLTSAAASAVQKLAAASGHALPATAAETAGASSSGGDPVAWLVFAAGALVIALAWGASLRARPPQWRRST
jgi:hypothetical protein